MIPLPSSMVIEMVAPAFQEPVDCTQLSLGDTWKVGGSPICIASMVAVNGGIDFTNSGLTDPVAALGAGHVDLGNSDSSKPSGATFAMPFSQIEPHT